MFKDQELEITLKDETHKSAVILVRLAGEKTTGKEVFRGVRKECTAYLEGARIFNSKIKFIPVKEFLNIS